MRKSLGGKWSMRFVLVVSLFALVAVGGCNDDEKKTKTKASQATEGSEATQPGTPSGVETRKRIALSPVSGTKAGSTALLDVPEDFVLYGGWSSFDDAVAVADVFTSKMGGGAMPAAALGEIVLQGAQAELDLKSMTWFERKRPLIAGMWMDDKGASSGVALVPIVGRDSLSSALPASWKKNVSGNDYQILVGGDVAYGNVISGYLVLTQHADRMAKSKSFIKGKLAAYRPESTIEVHLAAGVMTSRFKSEVDAVKDDIVRELAAEQFIPGFADISIEQVSYLFDVVAAVDWMSLSAKMKDAHALISLEVSEKKGTEALAILASHLAGRTPNVYRRLPENSYLVLGTSMNPGAGSAWADLSITAVGGVFGLSADEMTRLKGHLNKMVNNLLGDYGVALYPAGKYPLAVSMISAMTDGMAYRKDLQAITDLLWKKAKDMFAADLAEELPPGISLDSLSAAVNSVGPILEPFGVSIAITKDSSTKGIVVDTLTVKADVKKIQAAGDEEFIELVDVVGDTLSLSIGYGKDSMAIVLSPNAVEEAKAMVSRQTTNTHKGLQTAQVNGVPGANFIVYASVIDGIRAFSAIPDAQEIIQHLGSVSPGNGLGISLGVVGENGFRLNVDIPVDHVMSVVRATRGAYLQPQGIPVAR